MILLRQEFERRIINSHFFMPILVFIFALMLGSSLALTTIQHSPVTPSVTDTREPALIMDSNMSADMEMATTGEHSALTGYGSALLNR